MYVGWVSVFLGNGVFVCWVLIIVCFVRVLMELFVLCVND